MTLVVDGEVGLKRDQRKRCRYRRFNRAGGIHSVNRKRRVKGLKDIKVTPVRHCLEVCVPTMTLPDTDQTNDSRTCYRKRTTGPRVKCNSLLPRHGTRRLIVPIKYVCKKHDDPTKLHLTIQRQIQGSLNGYRIIILDNLSKWVSTITHHAATCSKGLQIAENGKIAYPCDWGSSTSGFG